MIPVFSEEKINFFQLTKKDLDDHYNYNRLPYTPEQVRDLIFEYLKKCNLEFEELVSISAALGNEKFVNKLVLARDVSYINCSLSFVNKKIHSVCYSYMNNDYKTKKLHEMYDQWAEEAEEIWIYIRENSDDEEYYDDDEEKY